MMSVYRSRPFRSGVLVFAWLVVLSTGSASAQVVPPSVGTAPESFLQGMAHTATWLGNKLLPICIGLFGIGAILTFAGHPALSMRLATGAFLCALGAGLFRLFDTVFVGGGYGEENALLIGVVRMINYTGN